MSYADNRQFLSNVHRFYCPSTLRRSCRTRTPRNLRQHRDSRSSYTGRRDVSLQSAYWHPSTLFAKWRRNSFQEELLQGIRLALCMHGNSYDWILIRWWPPARTRFRKQDRALPVDIPICSWSHNVNRHPALRKRLPPHHARRGHPNYHQRSFIRRYRPCGGLPYYRLRHERHQRGHYCRMRSRGGCGYHQDCHEQIGFAIRPSQHTASRSRRHTGASLETHLNAGSI